MVINLKLQAQRTSPRTFKLFVFSTLWNIVNGFIIINYREAEQDFPSVKTMAHNSSYRAVSSVATT